MNKINFSVGQAAGAAVMEVNADDTLTNTSGGASVFAGLVVARRGAPGKVLSVSASNYKSVLGTPYHPRVGSAFEPYRHVERAVKGGNGNVVRVCPSDMKVPGLVVYTSSTKTTTVTTGDTFSIVKASDTANTQATTYAPLKTPTVPDGAVCVFYVKDGDASANRSISLVSEGADSDLFTLTLNETLSDGTVNVLETHQVSFNPDATNDMGQPAWVTTMLDNLSTRLGAVLADNAETTSAGISFTNVFFQGGSDGTPSKLTTADYLAALEILESSAVNFTAVLSLGCYDSSALSALKTLAEDVRVDMFYDLKSNQTAANAITEASNHSFGGSHQPARYYFPFSCRDTFTGMQVVYGLSCDAFVAKAKGVALVPDVGGWHYSPAGLSRGIIDRQNIAKISGLGTIDNEAFVTARINTVSVGSDGDVYIDDALTTYTKNNYLRFQHVSSLMNAIARGFYEVAEAVKHEPDGVTQESLTKVMTDLLDRFYAAGALVTPRDTSQGTDPYVVEVIQKDFDLWQVAWSVCPTGTARRIVGKPILMR